MSSWLCAFNVDRVPSGQWVCGEIFVTKTYGDDHDSVPSSIEGLIKTTSGSRFFSIEGDPYRSVDFIVAHMHAEQVCAFTGSDVYEESEIRTEETRGD